jgi:Mrr restriction endonuclease-like protein
MKTLFTIHAGEYLVGAEIEKQCSDWEVWLPSRDTGIDLLIRSKATKQTKSIQVKFSKSWTETHTNEKIRKYFRTQGWWTLNKEKIKNSPADYWIFALYSFDTSKNDFIIISKNELIALYKGLKVWDQKTIHSYIWTLQDGRAFEGRSLGKKGGIKRLVDGEFDNTIRNLSPNLNNWKRLCI